MSLSLKLELLNNSLVKVINLQTKESREVNLGLVQDAARDSLSMLIQYKYYELIINAEAIWRMIEQSNSMPAPRSVSAKATSLILKLAVKDKDRVLVINSQTQESQLVTMRYIQEAAGDSLLMLAQYKHYELLINTDRIWEKVKRFDPRAEKFRADEIEQQFRNIMVNDQWMKITDYDRQMYHKALASWTDTYNSQSHKPSFDKFVFVPVAGGAAAGALTYSTVGGMGIAAAGTAFGVGALGMTALGTIGGLAAYGVGKALN